MRISLAFVARRRRIVPTVLSVCALSASALSMPVLATDTVLPETVVTASRISNTRAAAATTVISRDQISKSTARDVPELLRNLPGIQVRAYYGGGRGDGVIDLRGFGASASTNTLILLNGRRLNDVDLSGVDFSAIPLADIERIEVMPGGGAVLYGDGAVGGAINIVTRKAVSVQQDGSYRMGSHGLYAAQVRGSNATPDQAVSLFLGYQELNGYRDNNAQHDMVAGSDLRFQNDQGGEWFFSGAMNRSDLQTPGVRTVSPTEAIDQLGHNRRGTATPNDYADNDGWRMHGGWTGTVGDDLELVLDAGMRHKHQQAFQYSGVDTRLNTFSVTPRLVWQHEGSKITGGVDVYRSHYNSDRAQDDVSAPQHRLAMTQESRATYALAEQDLLSVLRLTAGARTQAVSMQAQDHYDSSAPGWPESEAAPLSQSDREDSYELTLNLDPVDAVNLYVRGSRAARFSTVDELFETECDAFWNCIKVFSPLKPQTANAIDLGVNVVSKAVTVRFNIYRQNLENEIHFNPQSFTNDNLDPTLRKGGSLDVSIILLDSLRVRGGYALTDATFRKGVNANNEVPLVARHTGSVGVVWQSAVCGEWSADWRYVGSRYFDNDQSNDFGQKIPDYTVVDVAWHYRQPRWSAQVGINNLLGREYYDYGVRSLYTQGRYNAYPLPERELSAGVNWRF